MVDQLLFSALLLPYRLRALALGLLLQVTLGSAWGQPALQIGGRTYLTGTGNVRLVYGGGTLTNNGLLNLPGGQLTTLGPTTYAGAGSATVATTFFNHAGNSLLSSLLSVTDQATLTTGTSLNANGQLYLRTDQFPSANLVNNGILTGTVLGLVTKATARTGPAGYPSTLSTNVSGSSMKYQWQASSDNTTFSDVPGATDPTYALTVNRSMVYRCLLSANNSPYTQATPGVLLAATQTFSATASANPNPVCVGSPTTLSATPTNGTPPYAYGWTAPPGAVLNANGMATVTATPTLAGVQTFTLTITDATHQTATATVGVTANQPPTAVLTNDGPLSCTKSSVTLTATGGQTYTFSPGATQMGNGNTATVTTAGTYSVTLTSASGCTATTSTTVTGDQGVPAVSITANPSLTIAPGQSTTLTATVSGGTPSFSYAWSTGATSSSIVAGTGGPYSVTATGANGCSGVASTSVTVTQPQPTGPFAITGVTTVSCDPIQPNRFSLSFTPRYQGLDGSPVSFSVRNELLPTTSPGPYTLQLYSDNPTITLNATQRGVSSSFVYNWLAACNASTTPNTPPRVAMDIPAQIATQGSYFSYVIPEGTFTDDQTPGSLKLTASGVPPGLNFSGATLSGTPSTTVGSPFSVTITATDPGGLSTSTRFSLTVLPATGTPPPTMPFAITGVTTLSCTPVADRINISFTPRYQAMSGQPIAFEVVNERGPTTDPAPYSLTLYRDNPVITLRATQTGSPGPVTFRYDWLVACQSLGQENTPPRLNEPVASQSATVGVGYSLNLSNTFIDQETPDQISLTASALPAGLVLNGKQISGTPSLSGVTSVSLTATDGGGLSSSTTFSITVSPASTTPPPPTTAFSITGVTTVSCEVISAGERRLTFTPRYGGENGSPISFSVVNELAPTTNQGPYALRLYTDNPVITLSAVQSGVASQFRYGWLAACQASARVGVESVHGWVARLVGNPVSQDVVVEITGAEGQRLELSLVDGAGHRISRRGVLPVGSLHREVFDVSHSTGGLLLLQVMDGVRSQTLKVIKQ